ncbi:hypothetical protein TI03_01060 [Achromatium sp. WMS1]|nr:hypothetical protein TI03_01060 [Achromatium sp. WMS1]
MYRVFIVILLSLCFSVSVVKAASTHHSSGVAADNNNKNLAMIGGGLLGLLLASGAVGLISTSTMVLEGAAITDALEAGAGLPMSLAVLSAILGALFTQDHILNEINAYQEHRAAKAAAAH